MALSPWEGDPDGMGFSDSASEQVIDAVSCYLIENRTAVLAALAEDRPFTDEELRAAGGEFIEETRDIIEWKPYDVWWFPRPEEASP